MVSTAHCLSESSVVVANSNQVPTITATLGNVAPFLVPAKTAIERIADIIHQADDNKSQCIFLLKRCAHLCLHVKRLVKEFRGDAARRYAEPLSELNR